MSDPFASPEPDEDVVADRSAPHPLEPPADAEERTGDRGAGVAEGTAAAVLEVARTQPFMRIFNRCAWYRFSDHANYVARMVEARPRWYWFCWWADILLMVLAVAVMLAAAAGVVYRTFYL